jgi:hypothetical protein
LVNKAHAHDADFFIDPGPLAGGCKV